MRTVLTSSLLAVLLTVAACGTEGSGSAQSTSAPSSSASPSGSGSASPSASPSSSASSTTSASPSPSAFTQWRSARAFLARQKEPVEVLCLPRGSRRVTELFSFDADRQQWRPFLGYRDDARFRRRAKQCTINVPTTHPYTTAGIEGFLNPLGFWFMDDSSRKDLTRVEIAYAGADAEDPDRVFAKTPGLWGLRMTLGEGPDYSRGIPRPRSERQAATFLEHAQPVLDWYGYSGS